MRLPLEEARDLKCGDLIKMLAENGPLALTEDGEVRYIIGGVDDLEWEALSLSRNPEFMAYLDACIERGNREGGIPLAEARRQLGVD